MNEQFEFKSAANGQISLDQAEGIVECFVAGIGNKDSVGDIVVTGAFAKSLTRRKPRVVWAHSWNDPIGKVLEMYEVPPGDPRLPAKMRNAGIGGLYAKVQFNLQSEKGKEAFASVAFFGEEQEWSIGYKTINGAFDPAQQANVLKEVELYEVSPVLHGANQLTGTISVKSEQKNHMMPVIAGMPMMGEQQQPRMIVIAAPEKEQEQDEPFNIFAEGLAQPLEADKVQKIQAELSERTGSKVDIVEATDSFIVFRRTTTDGKVSMYRVGYHTPDGYNTFMFGKPEAYSGNDNKPQIQQEIEVKPADASMVPMQPQQMPYRDDDQDEMNTMLGGQVGVGKSAYAHLIEIPQIHMVQAKSMLQPVFNYHNLSTTDSDNGIIVNGSISAQAIDALQTAVKAIGQTIGQSVGNLRTLAQSFNPYAIDGDNDGFAQDGTAFQRPYIPIKKPDMDLPEVGGKKRNSSELLDKPTIRTGKKPTKDPGLLQGQERQEALAAGELQPRTMDDISFLANRRPENEGLAKYWDMSEEGLRAEGQKLVAARRGQTGSAREATDGELFKISHEFSRREAYKNQFGKEFVPPKRTESTGRETFDVRDVEVPNNLTRPGREFTGYNPLIERDKEKQRIAKLAEEAIAEYEKGRSKRGFASRGDVTPEQQNRIDASRKRGADIASGRAQILADNLKNLSDEDKDTIREEGIVSFLLQDGTGGPLSGEWAGDSPAERIGDLLPEGDWSTDSELQADAEDIFASYEEGFYGQLDKEFADLVNPADLETENSRWESLSANEQDSILEEGRDSIRGLASRYDLFGNEVDDSAAVEDRVNKKRVRELQEEFGWDRDEAEAALNNWYELDGVDADEFDKEAGGDINAAIYNAWDTAQTNRENSRGFRSRGETASEGQRPPRTAVAMQMDPKNSKLARQIDYDPQNGDLTVYYRDGKKETFNDVPYDRVRKAGADDKPDALISALQREQNKPQSRSGLASSGETTPKGPRFTPTRSDYEGDPDFHSAFGPTDEMFDELQENFGFDEYEAAEIMDAWLEADPSDRDEALKLQEEATPKGSTLFNFTGAAIDFHEMQRNNRDEGFASRGRYRSDDEDEFDDSSDDGYDAARDAYLTGDGPPVTARQRREYEAELAQERADRRDRGFRSRGDETPELRPYDELTDKEKSDLYEGINDYLVQRNDTATIKNELEEGGFDYDDFLQKYPEFHPDSADFGDAGDMGFASRGERYWGYPLSYDSAEQGEKYRKVKEKLKEPVVRGEKSPMLSLRPFDSFSGYSGGGSQFVRKYEDSYDVTGAVREPIYQDDRAFQTQFADQIVKDFSRSDLTVAELADRFGITEAQVQDVLEDAAKQINDGMETPPKWEHQKYRLEDVQNLFSGTRKHTDIPEPSKAVLDARAPRREYSNRVQNATAGNIAHDNAMNELRQTEKFKKAAGASKELKRKNSDLLIPIAAEIKLREERAKLSGTEQENNLALLETYFDGQEIMDLLEEAGIDYQKPEDAFYYDDDRDMYYDDNGEFRNVEDLWLDWFVEEEFTDEEKESLSQAIQKYTDRITNAASRNRQELGVSEKDDLKTIRKAISDSEAEALKPVTEMVEEVRKKYPFENYWLIETPPQPSSLDGVRDDQGKYIPPSGLAKLSGRSTNDEDEGFASGYEPLGGSRRNDPAYAREYEGDEYERIFDEEMLEMISGEPLEDLIELNDTEKGPFSEEELTKLFEENNFEAILDGLRDQYRDSNYDNISDNAAWRYDERGFGSRGSSQDGELDSYGFGKPVKINKNDDWQMSRFDEIDRQSQQDFIAELEADDYFADGDYDDADKLSLAADEWNGRGLETRERYTDEMLGELYELENIAETFTNTERNGTDFEGSAFAYVEELIKNPMSSDFSDYEEARKTMDSIRTSLRRDVIDREESGGDDESGFASRGGRKSTDEYKDEVKDLVYVDRNVISLTDDFRDGTQYHYRLLDQRKNLIEKRREIAMEIAEANGVRITASTDQYDIFGGMDNIDEDDLELLESMNDAINEIEDTLEMHLGEFRESEAESQKAAENLNLIEELGKSIGNFEDSFEEDMLEELDDQAEQLKSIVDDMKEFGDDNFWEILSNDQAKELDTLLKNPNKENNDKAVEILTDAYVSALGYAQYDARNSESRFERLPEPPSYNNWSEDYPEDRLFEGRTSPLTAREAFGGRNAAADETARETLRNAQSGFASRGGSRFDTMETPYSSAIEAVHYDRNTRELHVAFKPGQTGGEARYYTYSGVPADYFDNEISGSSSIGRVINDVKKNYDVEVTNPRTVDAINGRGEVASAPGKLGPWSETRSRLNGSIVAEGDDYYYRVTPTADGTGRYTTSAMSKRSYSEVDRMPTPQPLEQAKAWADRHYRENTRATTPVGGRSEIQDIDVRRSAALYESYYDPNAEELVVTFKDKDGNAAGSYIYEGVTADEANELASASSKGKVINRLKASKSVRRAGADDRMTRTPGAADEVGAGGYEAQVDSHWDKIGPDEQRAYFARAVDSAINAGTGTSADEITADAKARAYDDRQIAMMEMQAEKLGMGYRKIDVGSSAALNRVEYDPDKRELRVEYRGRDGKGNGEFYVYQNVPQSVVDDIEASDSRGATLRRVRDDFEFRTESAIPESAFYSMGDAGDMGERSNPKITNRTNANGFYLDENGRATNYNKRSYTTADIQKINGRRNGRDGFASGRLGPAPDDAEYGRELAAQRARDRAAGRNATNPIGNRRAVAPNMPDIDGMDEETASDALEKSDDELFDFVNEIEKQARRSLGDERYNKEFGGAVPYIEELSKNHDGGVDEHYDALSQAMERAKLYERDVVSSLEKLDSEIEGFSSRGSINESSTGQRIVPSRMHSDDREALAEITDPEERKQRIDELIEFYGPRIFAKPSKPKRKPSDYDEDGFLIENDGFASRQTSAFNPDMPPFSVDEELDMNVSIFNYLDRPVQSLGERFSQSAEYEPSINTTKWSDLRPNAQTSIFGDMVDNNRAYFNKMSRDGASLGEVMDEVGRLWDDEVRASVTSLERALKKVSDDYSISARERLMEANPRMSQKEIDDMLVDLGLSENDFERLFSKNMDAYELASAASDLENKRREIVAISTPKTGGDRPKVDPLSILGGYSDGDVFGLTPRGFASRGASGSKKKTKEEVYAEMTKQLIDALSESEKLGKWQLPWRRMGLPENGTTGHKYSGSNWFFLTAMTDIKGYNSNKWATYDQWQGIGGQVRKGEKATSIFVPIFLKGREKADGTEEKGTIRFISRSVFNLDQIDGLPEDFDKKEILPESERVADLEKTISEIPAVIKNGGDEAYFSPTGDYIQLPRFENFKDARAYYSTIAHELMHWTGGKDRLDRDNMNRFGTPEYAYEELIAEIASAMFMSAHNIEPNVQENHGPYLAFWIKRLKDDPTALERAMKDAQSAVNYILNISPNAKSKFSNGERTEFENPDIAVPTEPVVAVEGFASRGDWPTPGGYEPGEFDMRTALSQIGRGNLMAISGTRAKKRNNEMVLPVNRNQQVIVGYDGGSDTYFVRAEQIITNGKDKGKTRVLGQWDNVYADELGETAYQASLKPSMLSDENKTVWAQAFDHPQTGSLLDENGQVYENGLASGGDSMDPDELDAMDWAYDAAQDYLMEQEDMMPEEPSPEDGFASRMNLSTPEKNEIISIARGMNTPFTRSVVAQYDRNGELSDRQWDALNRMTLRGNRSGFPSRGGDKRPRTPKARWSPEDRQRYADGDRLRSKKRPGKRRNGPDASEYGFGSRGADNRPSIDMIESDIFFEGERNGRSWGFEPIISIVAEQFGGRKNMSNRQLAKELGVSEAVAEKMRKPGARTSDIYLLDDLRVRVAGDDRSIWGPNNDPLAYYDESGKPITDEDRIPDVEDLAPDVPGTRAPKEGGARTYIDPTAVFEEVGIDANASKYSIVRDNSDVFNRRVWDRIMTRGITEDEINALLKAKKSSKRSTDIYTPEQLGAVKQKRTDSMPLADIFKNQAFDSLRGKRGFPQQVAEAITEITGRRPAISTVKAFINQPRSSGSQTGRNPFAMTPAQIRLLLDNLGISAEEFEKFRSE